jgi:hypothetical protein
MLITARQSFARSTLSYSPFDHRSGSFVRRRQGDQMSLWKKIAQKFAQPIIVKKYAQLLEWKKYPKILEYFFNLHKTTQNEKWPNYLAKNSPNLVTLGGRQQQVGAFFKTFFFPAAQDLKLHSIRPNKLTPGPRRLDFYIHT